MGLVRVLGFGFKGLGCGNIMGVGWCVHAQAARTVRTGGRIESSTACGLSVSLFLSGLGFL